MQTGEYGAAEDDQTERQSGVRPTTRRALLQAAGTTALGVLAASVIGKEADAQANQRSGMHIPIGMVVHADTSPTTGVHLHPGRVELQNPTLLTGTLRVIMSTVDDHTESGIAVTLFDTEKTIIVTNSTLDGNGNYPVMFSSMSDIGTITFNAVKITDLHKARFSLWYHQQKLAADVEIVPVFKG